MRELLDKKNEKRQKKEKKRKEENTDPMIGQKRREIARRVAVFLGEAK